jgi:hypothetical protein
MEMKERIKKYKYLFIGGIMGIVQQFAGRLDYMLYKGHDIFSFSAIMGGLSIYAAIILFTIKRDVPPKQQFRDLFLFFFGLDFFYYLYIFVLDIIEYITVPDTLPDYLRLEAIYFQNTKGEIIDFIKWTTIGTAAAIWVYFTTKFRNDGKKKHYSIMMLPLFAVIALELISSCVTNVTYVIQEYKVSHGTLLPEESKRTGDWSSLTVTLFILGLCVYKFFIKPNHQPKSQLKAEA